MIVLSIGIPLYNCGDSIGKNLKIISHQIGARNDIEVVICDNKSTDNSVEIVKTYVENDPRIRLILNSSNIGMDKNVIKVVENSAGKYIHILSADDFYIDGAVEKIINTINKYPDLSIIILSNQYLNVFSGEIITMKDINSDSYCNNILEFLEKEQLKALCISNVVLNKDILLKDVHNLNDCVGTLWPHLYFIKEVSNIKTKYFVFSYNNPVITVQLGNQGWVKKNALFVYYRAIKLYEEIASKQDIDFSHTARLFINGILSPNTQKSKNLFMNILLCYKFFPIYLKYYEKDKFIAWVKFCIKLIFSKKEDFAKHLYEQKNI